MTEQVERKATLTVGTVTFVGEVMQVFAVENALNKLTRVNHHYIAEEDAADPNLHGSIFVEAETDTVRTWYYAKPEVELTKNPIMKGGSWLTDSIANRDARHEREESEREQEESTNE